MKKAIFIFAVMALGIAIASPVKSIVGARETFLAGSDEPSMPTAADYVQEGLIVLLDGIENVGIGMHDETSPVWVDLVSGQERAIGNRQWREDGLYWNNTSTLTLYPDAITGEAFFTGDKTLELCGSTSSTTYRNVGLQGQSSFFVTQNRYGTSPNRYYLSLMHFYDVQNWIIQPLRVDEQDGIFDNVEHRTSFVMKDSYVQPYYNGVAIMYNRAVTVPSYTTGFTSFIWAGAIGCRINCIRIYNRALMPEEVMYNHEIDKVRFGL